MGGKPINFVGRQHQQWQMSELDFRSFKNFGSLKIPETPYLSTMKPVAIIIAKYSGILFVWLLLLWWALFFSPIDVPEYIPYTPVGIYGLLIVTFTLTILIFAQKEALRKMPALNVGRLVLIGTAICFIKDVFFQFILTFTETSDKLHYFIKGTISTTIFGAAFSFFVAFQLKTKKTNRLVLIIIGCLILFKVLTMIFPGILKP